MMYERSPLQTLCPWTVSNLIQSTINDLARCNEQYYELAWLEYVDQSIHVFSEEKESSLGMLTPY